MSPDTEELIDRMHAERVSRSGRQSATLDMPYQGQGQYQVRSPKVITNYLCNWVSAAHDFWVILFIECNSETQKVIRVNDRSRSGRHQGQVRSKGQILKLVFQRKKWCISDSVFYSEFVGATFISVGGVQPPQT